MSEPLDLKSFLESIMQINVMTMGGAAAGIVGSSDATNDVVNSLKRSSVAFAREYQKPAPVQAELEQAAGQVMGYLQTLQIMNVLSENTTAMLMSKLDTLMGKEST